MYIILTDVFFLFIFPLKQMSELIADINTVTDEEVTLDHNRNMPHQKATADTTAVREKKFELSWHLNRIDKIHL